MAPPRDFLELTHADWLAEVAASDGVPGGGSVLAAAVAGASAVLVMAARVSGAVGLLAQAEALHARSLPLAQLDADAYAAALSAAGRFADEGQAQRDFQVGRAFALAAEPPLEIARAAADIAELAAEVASTGDPRVHADALAAGALAVGAARGAVVLVEVNLTAVDDDPRIAEARQLAEGAARALARVR